MSEGNAATAPCDLVGWKAIAGVLDVCTYTARVYERFHGLKVYRRLGRVRAYRAEVEAWAESARR